VILWVSEKLNGLVVLLAGFLYGPGLAIPGVAETDLYFDIML
jgi:hypothetical protein